MNTIAVKSLSMIVLSALSLLPASGQRVVDATKAMPIEITYNKTSTIVFPAAIRNVDPGSRDLMVQKVNGSENILQLKAATKQRFTETNLTVVTADGKLNHFIVNYAENPQHLTLKVVSETDGALHESSSILFKSGLNSVEVERYARAIIAKKKDSRITRQKKNKISMALEGFYIKGNLMFCHIEVNNRSNIGYDIDMLRLHIKDKRNIKRTASQEIQIKPLFIYNESQGTIKGKSTAHVVYALEKFTIPDAKNLIIEMFERNGGRHLNLRVNNKAIVNAIPVPRN